MLGRESKKIFVCKKNSCVKKIPDIRVEKKIRNIGVEKEIRNISVEKKNSGNFMILTIWKKILNQKKL